jgi:NADPH:quinone reductase-like Zn-dependent oxidoreductase
MKAIAYQKYGSPDVLELVEQETPVPADDEVLIRVHAASANPLDWHKMRGTPIIARMMFGLHKPKDTRLGADVAGRVEAIGRNITQFQPGDDVFGMTSGSAGAFAEYVCSTANRLALKPANISFEEAASAPVAAFTALQGLRDAGKIRAGQKVLINGASGGVGTFAVQIAKSFGAEVTGVTSTRNLDMVRSIGADHVIVYTKEDFTRSGKQYDLIFDAVANHSVLEYKRALNPNGICSVAGFSTMSHMFQEMIMGTLVSKMGDKTIGGMGVARPNREDLLTIGGLLESGKVKPVIDKRYTLSQVSDAIRYLETGRARGKVVITVTETK